MKKFLPLVLLLLFFFTGSPALAVSTTPTRSPTVPAGRGPADSNTATVSAPVCVQSTFGCIPTDPVQLVGLILQIVLGFAGGIAFLMMIWGSIRLISSGGSPDAIKVGKEYITYAVLGMLIVVFSVFLLGLIGVRILKIPGLG